MKQKFYNHPWDEDKVNYVLQWAPHFGAASLAEELSLTIQQIRSKLDRNKIKLLPKNQRLCYSCKINFQVKSKGLFCLSCFNKNRKQKRLLNQRTTLQWIKESVNTAKHRSKVVSDLTHEFMLDLWNQQNGMCYYSGIKMIEPQYGNGRNPFSPSIDKIDPSKGYIKSNVVWCSWICNSGKSELSQEEYINLCRQIIVYQDSLQ